jgi:hypothetical protein
MKPVRNLASAVVLMAAGLTSAIAQTAVPAKAATAASGAGASLKPVTAGAATLDQCEKQAGDRSGEARKSFLKSCLKPVGGQQGKMKQCNAEAKGKKGDERRTFMSECLRKKKT